MKVCRPNVRVFDSKDDMSHFIIETWREISQKAIERKGFFSVALSGGKTPIGLYYKLSSMKQMLPWDKTHIFLVDERFVPLEHRDSNYRMLKETLLDHIPIPQGNIHSIPTDRSTPQASAMAYEEDIKKFFRSSEDQIPEFDFLLLGLGEDGHTASLFPSSPVLKERDHLASAVILDEIRHDRITLTLPVLNHAKHVVFLVTGKGKAAVLEKVVKGKDSSLPASMAKPESGDLVFLIDREANSQLDTGTKC
jgi:6-phosphogluconolactonase